MPQLGTAVDRNFFRIFSQGFNTMANEMESSIRQHFNEQVALGRSPLDVLNELESARTDDSGLLRRITAGVEGRLDLGTATLFQIGSNDPLRDAAEFFVWRLDPTAEHCDSCLYQASLPPRKYEDIPFPTTQETVGETNCTRYCKCTVEIANVA